MRYLLQILCLSTIFPALLLGQFNDNFDDGDFTVNPTWSGDVDKFTVNSDFELQLNDESAGSSMLYLPVSISPDFTWKMDLEMNFDPSANNQSRVYLFLDNLDPGLANGYYFEIGENLAQDAIHFYRLDDGVATLLASCESGAVAQKPAQVSLKIDRVEGLWTVATDYSKQGLPVEEISFFDDTYDFLTSGFFRIETKYTSSNSKAFYFDNIDAASFVPDTEGPVIIGSNIISPAEIHIVFNESILVSSLDNLILGVSPTDNPILSATLSSTNNNVLEVVFQNEFSSGVFHEISVQGLEDEKSNLMEEGKFSFKIALSPSLGDVVINEILFDPVVGGSDYVEILNYSDKLLDLKGLVILNASKQGSEEFIVSSILLEPGKMVALSADTNQVKSQYTPELNSQFYEMKLPSFNQDEGNVSLLFEDVVLDSFDYTEDIHNSLLDVTKGVSLERIFPNSASIPENFTSGVKSTNYGTPGYRNASFKDGNANNKDVFFIENTVFSPNGDGQEDLLIMNISLPEDGYLTTIQVFNLSGQKIKTIQTNQLTGKTDISKWNGTMDDGTLAAVGHYIIYFQAFHTNGDRITDKKHIKLLDFF